MPPPRCLKVRGKMVECGFRDWRDRHVFISPRVCARARGHGEQGMVGIRNRAWWGCQLKAGVCWWDMFLVQEEVALVMVQEVTLEEALLGRER